ncbi:bacteriocin fulvocin C-related protein [Streptomyces oceani]|uniref:Bacteriocin fulvocin C-related protein n=1 Tax=Streptomyces oceani TaxID=1075402 RepID=A0A1E7KLK5_9ACTN|nr:bacteriocin fulvocin C-related protein [Streptomyces oceani]OEV04783.1 hypothetical protein AN216_05790 [Streptomyces oceani]
MSKQAKLDRWVLAFDGSCDTCKAISEAVEQASQGKLEVLPLGHPDVQEWRRLSVGPEPPWEPTLVHVRGEQVQAWTRPLMGLLLAKKLGPRATYRVLQSLGRLRTENRNETQSRGSIDRKRFLQLFGGIGVATAITVTGQTPAFAQSPKTRAAAWVAANKDRLPHTYAGITQHPAAYRPVILAALPPRERAQAWVEHFDHYRRLHPNLTAEQSAVINDAEKIAKRVFADGRDQRLPELRRLEAAAKHEFGPEGAAGLLVNYGPAEASVGPEANCTCATDSDYCGTYCSRGGCQLVGNSCGSLGLFDCNGRCT